MHTESSEPRAVDSSSLERAIVLQLLRDDHDQRWSREELRTELDADAIAVESALRRLHGEGVLCLAEEEVRASPAARRLDELGLISI